MAHRPRKRFGQHFLRDPQVIERILRALDPRPGERLVEIGPGRGALTLPLLREARSLLAIELDRDLIPRLEAAARGLGALQLRQADALSVDYRALADELGGPLRLVGNLPYNISTPLLFHLFAQGDAVADMLFMLQREVVDRLAAAPGAPAYGRLGVMAQYHCRVAPHFVVPPGCFEPPPAVDSAIVSLDPHPQPPVDAEPARLARVLSAAFAQRRKTLRNSLRPLLAPGALAACGIDPGLRPERITLAQFAAISRQPFADTTH